MAPLSKKHRRILETLSESDKAAIFVKSGTAFALRNGVTGDSLEDIMETGYDLLRNVVVGDLINIVAVTLTPKGKPPSTSDLIMLFNELMSYHGDCIKNIESNHKRFINLVETLTLTTKGAKNGK